MLKLDVNGNKIWDKTLGGFYNDKLTSLTELPNTGGYVIGGYSYSQNNGSKTITNLGTESNADYWVVVLNNNGNERMQNLFGGGSHEIMTCVAPVGLTGINSYYAAGWSYSSKRPGYKSEKMFMVIMITILSGIIQQPKKPNTREISEANCRIISPVCSPYLITPLSWAGIPIHINPTLRKLIFLV